MPNNPRGCRGYKPSYGLQLHGSSGAGSPKTPQNLRVKIATSENSPPAAPQETSEKPPEVNPKTSGNTRRHPEAKPSTSGHQRQHPKVSLRRFAKNATTRTPSDVDTSGGDAHEKPQQVNSPHTPCEELHATCLRLPPEADK